MNSQNDMAWPSVSRIAGECGLSEQCVRKHLKILCAEGWLVKQGTSQLETNIYQASTPPAIIAPLQSISLPPATIAPELNKELNNILHKGFRPPTIQEVEEYTATRPIKIDSERFIDFYQSKGWMVGKNKMKDWRAAVRNWEKTNNGQARQSGKNGGSHSRVKTVSLRDIIN
jgi:Helix-turn-helix domain